MRTCRWFVEHRTENLALEDIENAVTLDLKSHLVRKGEEVMDILVSELLHAQDVLPVERRMWAKVRESLWDGSQRTQEGGRSSKR